MTQLVKYEAARAALAEAKSIDEVASILDKAEAVRHYARIAGDKQLEVDAVEIRLRAKRRLGQLIRTHKQSGLLRTGRAPKLKLRDLKISRNLSYESQRLAVPTEEDFEKQVATWRARSLCERGTAVSPPTSFRRIQQKTRRLDLPRGDIRTWSVAQLRRLSSALAAVTDRCGGADGSERVGDCVSDSFLMKTLS